VAKELEALGERPRIEEGGVEWDGDARSIMRANLWLRTASRVVVRVAQFRATAFYELEKRAKKIPWGQFLGGEGRADFRVTAHKSRLYHSDAIAQRLNGAAGVRTKGRDQLFIVRVVRDVVTISADTSGDLLHMRGYRQAVGKAPLRETLAAALLLAAQWRGDTSLVDPFCGSGTIPIEGAMIAQRIAPGLSRSFAFMGWEDFMKSAWEELLRDARSRALASSPVPITGSDRDAGAIASAQSNAARAGVDATFAARPISAVEANAASGLIATNPPYGVRVGDRDALRNLYARFGQIAARRFGGWDVVMLVGDTRLAGQTGLDTREILRTTNGGLKVVALAAALPIQPPAATS
jgi:putative N6-adenine-specific DNA methylase